MLQKCSIDFIYHSFGDIYIEHPIFNAEQNSREIGGVFPEKLNLKPSNWTSVAKWLNWTPVDHMELLVI